MATKLRNALALQLLRYQERPDAPVDCLEFQAAASSGGFQGRVKFSAYKRDLEAFLDDLVSMVRRLSGEAHLRCGWGQTVNFEMRVFYYDRRGHIAVELELADDGPRGRMRRLSTEVQTEPAALERFAVAWRRTMEDHSQATIQLADLGHKAG